jgi:hypothetical protein
MNKVALALVVACVAAPASAATVTFNFGLPSGDLGTSHTYIDAGSGLSIVATGYDATGKLTDLFGKNNGDDEVGLGLKNDPTGDNEIHFQSGFVQLDVSALIGKVKPMSTFFSTNSTTEGEEWGVYGSNTAGSFSGMPLLTGTTETVKPVPDLGMFKYYDFVEINHTMGQGDNFLVHQLTTMTTGVPEPATWATMLLGFFGLGARMRARRRQAIAV